MWVILKRIFGGYKRVKCTTAVIRFLAEPYQSAPGTLVDGIHECDLLTFLLVIILIDTNLVNPEQDRNVTAPEMA